MSTVQTHIYEANSLEKDDSFRNMFSSKETSVNRILNLRLSKHATERMAQRGVSLDAIQFALSLGDLFTARAGCVAYYLSRKALSNAFLGVKAVPKRINNLAVVVSSDGCIVTVMRTEKPQFDWEVF